MPQSSNKDYFFQTSHSLAESTRKTFKSKNKHGSPIRLQSKILAIASHPADLNAVYVAESSGSARRIVLDVGEIIIPGFIPLMMLKRYCPKTAECSHVYRGSTAPLTSLALSTVSGNDSVFAGSWDKSIWSWDRITRALQRRYFGHTDFVNVVLCIRVNGTDVLISGASDASIIVWNTGTGEKLHTLRGGHTRAILELAVDPVTYPLSPFADSHSMSIVILSAGSDRQIRRWCISGDLSSARETEAHSSILQHETSVYNLVFDTNDDLWTASADGSVKCLSRETGWQADTTLVHGDYVRAVAVDERGVWVVSAGRDENVKIWDRASGKLHHIFSGHFEEITGIVFTGQTLVTVSIDATIRRWSLKPEDLEKAAQEAEEAKNGASGQDMLERKKALVTDDEDKELAELMKSDAE